jgi:phage virion morphogenesis protein
MTGAAIVSEFDDVEIRSAIDRLVKLSGNMAPLLKRIGLGMVDVTHQHFLDGKDPHGAAWKALRPDYAAEKKGPGILREKAMRGGLMGSITFQLAGSNAVAWGTNKKYGAVHQFGAVIRPVKAKNLVFHIGKRVVRCKQVVIPARPYLGFGPQEQRVVTEMVNLTLSEAITGYAARSILRGS